jgi:hypothetical protein
LVDKIRKGIKMPEELQLTSKEGRMIVYGDSEDFNIVEEKITSVSRWSIHYRIVIARKTDGKFFVGTYSKGATESQEEHPFDYSEPNFVEAVAVSKNITVYEKKIE